MTPPTAEYETFSLEQVCEMTGAPSPDWLYRLIASGEQTAVLAGRDWRMTKSDMCRLVDRMRAAAEQKLAARAVVRSDESPDAPTNPTRPAKRAGSTNPAGLSQRSAARMRRHAV